MAKTKRIVLALVLLAAAVSGLTWYQKWSSKPAPATLVKVYDADCMMATAGEQYDIAEVESAPLCASIARAYNFARTAERPEQVDEFGFCWDKYSFHCVTR